MKRPNSVLSKVFCKLNGIKYGKNLKLHGWCFMFRFPQASIEIKDNVTINSSFFSNFIGLYKRTIIVARCQGKVSIGNNVGLSGVTISARESIEIDDYATVGANTKIFDNDFHSLDAEERKNDIYDNLVCKPVRIGKNVFIGCNCIILKGTELGDNCVVGAGSVVSGKFEPNSVIAGNPARVIRKLEAM
jgi:acetyltransferase-like isoleucine patch superfamily enzyme